jgi:predicted TIM-barrel fold metal-dependent hydrolase
MPKVFTVGGRPVVDGHCHIGESWYEPIESLQFHMDLVGVSKAVLVQFYGLHDNSYQQSIVRASPDRFAGVVRVDPRSPEAVGDLGREIDQGARGFRLHPTERSPGSDPLAIWRAAEERNVVVGCLGTAEEFGAAEFSRLVESVPTLRIAIEHLGSWKFQPHFWGPVEHDREGVFALGRYSNVYLKLGGLGEFAERRVRLSEGHTFEEPIPNFYERAYASFGAERLLWGSGYPGPATREGYRNSLMWPLELFDDLPEEERGRIFGGTADELYFS